MDDLVLDVRLLYSLDVVVSVGVVFFLVLFVLVIIFLIIIRVLFLLDFLQLIDVDVQDSLDLQEEPGILLSALNLSPDGLDHDDSLLQAPELNEYLVVHFQESHPNGLLDVLLVFFVLVIASLVVLVELHVNLYEFHHFHQTPVGIHKYVQSSLLESQRNG